jgi:hypothetical protein
MVLAADHGECISHVALRRSELANICVDECLAAELVRKALCDRPMQTVTGHVAL